MDQKGKPGRKDAPTAPPRQAHVVDASGDLYGLEADDFAACALDGRPPRVSSQETIGNVQLLERLRKQIGLAY
jgi:hypothetical protein